MRSHYQGTSSMLKQRSSTVYLINKIISNAEKAQDEYFLDIHLPLMTYTFGSDAICNAKF